jgi:hypothetical protein
VQGGDAALQRCARFVVKAGRQTDFLFGSARFHASCGLTAFDSPRRIVRIRMKWPGGEKPSRPVSSNGQRVHGE